MRTGWRCPTLALLAMLQAACGDRTKEPAATTSETPITGGTVVIAGTSDFDNLNPLVSVESYTQEVNRDMLFLPLVRYTNGLDYEPALARSWKMLGDTGVVFYLRNDVRWHDGTPTTAADVMFTYERAKDPETAYPTAEDFSRWTSAKMIDSLTVQFTWERHAEPLAGLPFLGIMPKHLLDSVPAASLRMASFNKHPIGNGPFKFESYKAGDRWTFVANTDFPAGLGGRPYLDRVIWRIMPDNTAQIAELMTGSVDMILAPRAEQLKNFQDKPDMRVIVRPSRRFANVGWNGRRPMFSKPEVRRALTMAMDRQSMINTLRSGYGDLAVGPIAPYHWAYDSTITPLPFNPDSAKALLKTAGIYDRNGDGIAETADGKPFTFELMYPANSPFNRDIGEIIVSNLANVGVKAVPKPTEGATMFGIISSPARKFDAVIVAWEADFRINLRDVYHSASLSGPFQLAGYSNPRVDALIDSVSKVTDRAAAKPLYSEIQKQLRDDQPWSFLYYYPDLFIVRNRVHGTEMDIRGALLNIGKWWVTPGAAQSAAQAARSDSAGRSPAPDSAR